MRLDRRVPDLLLNADETIATLVLAEGERVSSPQALVFLAKRGVRHGRLLDALARLPDLTGPLELVVAMAEPARLAVPGSITLPAGDARAECRPRRVGPRELAFPAFAPPQLVQPGDVVATKSPPRPGQPALTVTGKPLGEAEAAPGQATDVALVAGPGTALDPDGLTLRATAEGHVRRTGDAVTVVPARHLAGDLEGLGAPLHVEGDLVVTGHLIGPRAITATGDVVVLGGAESATIAAGGRIVVQGGVRHGCDMQAGEAVVARFVEGSRIHCTPLAVVAENLAHATLGEVAELVVGGSLVGGHVTLSGSLVADTLGGPLQTPTPVAIVLPPPPPDPRPALVRERHELDAKLAQVRIRIDEAQRVVARHGQRGKGAEAQVLLDQLKALYVGLAAQDKQLEERLMGLSEAKPVAAVPHAEVLGRVLPGVTLQLGGTQLRPDVEFPACVLREGLAGIDVIPLG